MTPPPITNPQQFPPYPQSSQQFLPPPYISQVPNKKQPFPNQQLQLPPPQPSRPNQLHV